MIINGPTLVELEPLWPMETQKEVHKESGTSYGLTECGYDIRIAEDIWMYLGKRFTLSFSMEKFRMPHHLMARVLNKSTWARRGIDASMTTNIEPGWVGFLTIELRYSGVLPIKIPTGSGIAQIIFEEILSPSEYSGKYQHQPSKPVKAIKG